MIRLIKNELKKIFKKKSFYIVSIIFILYCILTNVLYKNINVLNIDNILGTSVDIEDLKEENENLDLDNEDDLLEYVTNLSLIETEELKKEINNNTASYLIDNYLYDLIQEANIYKYIGQDNDAYDIQREDIDKEITRIKANDWQYYTNLKIKNYQNEVDNAANYLAKERLFKLIELEQYRLNNDLGYDQTNYLNQAIEDMEIDYLEYLNLRDKENKSADEKERYYQLEEEIMKDNYILENKVDLNKGDSLNAVLRNFPNEFGLFILIYTVMISGSIVSEEFNKGTIKSLLTKPYKRSKIIISKLLTVLLLIPVLILMMILGEIIIGGLILGFKSLATPVLIFNSHTLSLVKFNIFIYLLLSVLSVLPMYLVLGCFCFMLSTLTNSTSAAITITFLVYLFGNIASSLALTYNLKILKLLVSLHWDFSYLVNCLENPYGFKWLTSLIVILIYLIIMVVISVVNFAKKDVKNI